jgi:hypothetical protein
MASPIPGSPGKGRTATPPFRRAADEVGVIRHRHQDEVRLDGRGVYPRAASSKARRARPRGWRRGPRDPSFPVLEGGHRRRLGQPVHLVGTPGLLDLPDHLGGPHGEPHPEPGQPVELGEGPDHDDPARPGRHLQEGVRGVVGVGLVQEDDGGPVAPGLGGLDDRLDPAPGLELAGGVVGSTDVDETAPAALAPGRLDQASGSGRGGPASGIFRLPRTGTPRGRSSGRRSPPWRRWGEGRPPSRRPRPRPGRRSPGGRRSRTRWPRLRGAPV